MFTYTEGKNARKNGAAALTMAASVRYEALDVEEKTRLNAVASELVEEQSMTVAQRIKEGTKIFRMIQKKVFNTFLCI